MISRIKRYCCPNQHTSASVLHSWNQALRIIVSLCVLQTQTRPDVGENVKDDSSEHITYLQSSEVQVLWSSHHLFHLLELLSVTTGLAIAALPWMLDLWSSRTVFVETDEYRDLLPPLLQQQLCHFQTQSSSTHGDSFHLVLVFGHSASELMTSSHDLCMPSQPWELLLWIDLTKWPFCLQKLQLNAHQQAVQFVSLTSLPFCSTFLSNVTKHNM